MQKSLTVWVTPFTSLGSLDDAVARVKTMASSINAFPNMLVPTNFGPWPQAQCTQSLPQDMLVGAADDVTKIRAAVEGQGVGFGVWGVPVNNDDPRAPGVQIPELMAQFAAAAGYIAFNFEPGVFWVPGDNPGAVDEFFGRFWNALPDSSTLDGNTCATIVPNQWGLGAFQQSLPNLAGGTGALAAEVYGGLQTAASYPAPNLWPSQSFTLIRQTGVEANLIPILADENLQSQASLASKLGQGNIHAWAI